MSFQSALAVHSKADEIFRIAETLVFAVCTLCSVQQVASLQHIVSLLSCEHISYMEVQLRPHRTDDFVTKLFYESNRFHLIGHSWIMKVSSVT